jgi:hypothetical protein
MAALVETQTCGQAEEFLSMLSPMHALWSDDGAGWIFRGQANAEWKLHAKALRASAARDFEALAIPGDVSNWSVRQGAVVQMLADFQDRLDRSGVPIPTPLYDLHDRGMVWSSDEPHPQAFPLMALAQHHGLPTLFLDWSRQARVGAYFAASAAVDPDTHGKGDLLAVWALRTEHRAPETHAKLRKYYAPASTNPNLRAQAGLFTILSTDDGDSVEEYVERGQANIPKPAMLRRYTLPTSAASRLLRLLSNEGVDGASMFPGADGVVRAMRERNRWDR